MSDGCYTPLSMITKQSDIQANGGCCAQGPVSCLLWTMLNIAGIRPKTIIDLTYGKGIFYRCFPDDITIWGFDPNQPDEFVREPTYFVHAPAWAVEKYSFVDADLIVVDPPFSEGDRKSRPFYTDRANVAVKILRVGLEEAKKRGVPVLIHYAFGIRYPGFRVLVETYFEPYVRHLNIRWPTWFGILEPGGDV